MNTFLLIDTATPAVSVALSYQGEIIFSALELKPDGGASARAGVLVERAVAELKARGLQLSAIGISAGPGSYTGLRIGSSLAKGLCHGFGVPLIAVSTLEVMSAGYRQRQGLSMEGKTSHFVPMIDARRMEVYTATYDLDGQQLAQDRPYILEADKPFAEDMESVTYHFFGDGAAKTQGLWPDFSYQVDADFVPEARHMSSLVEERYRAGLFVDTAYWTPNYLKEYVATIARNKVLG